MNTGTYTQVWLAEMVLKDDQTLANLQQQFRIHLAVSKAVDAALELRMSINTQHVYCSHYSLYILVMILHGVDPINEAE